MVSQSKAISYMSITCITRILCLLSQWTGKRSCASWTLLHTTLARLHGTATALTEWVSEQFLNGTSAQYRISVSATQRSSHSDMACKGLLDQSQVHHKTCAIFKTNWYRCHRNPPGRERLLDHFAPDSCAYVFKVAESLIESQNVR